LSAAIVLVALVAFAASALPNVYQQSLGRSTWEVTVVVAQGTDLPLASVSLRIEDDPTAVISGVIKQPNGTRLRAAVSHGVRAC
jgi:uncharacterized RDD family membrane protein YckC